MKVSFSPIYSYKHLPPGHRFPMEKYELLPELLLYEGTLSEEDFIAPTPLTEAQILRTHDKEYWEKLKTGQLSKHEIRAMGFPFHPTLVERGRHISQGTLSCAKYALQYGIGLNIAGGTHHAFADRGEGFCMFNDFAIAANELLYESLVQKIMIVDLDVHQGNGTAKIFENQSSVFTFSMHGEHNYPLKKEYSDYDLPVKDGIEDKEYLALLTQHLPPLIAEQNPDIIFYLSGVDVLSTDKLGRLALTKEGCKQRDQFIYEYCAEHSIPVVVSMGGGYSKEIWDIVDAHANTFRLAKAIFS